MLRFKLIFIFLFAFFLGAMAQSKKLWLLSADESYKKKDFASAAHYYSRALDDTTILETFVMPYEVQIVNLKSKSWVKVPELNLKKKKSKTDSIQVKEKDKSEDVLASKYDFILYKLANSYRLNADYKHAAETYKKCVDRKVFPDAQYYYALSLMNLQKYNEALAEFDAYVTSGKTKNDSLLALAQKKEASCYFALDSTNSKRKLRVRMFDTLIFNRGTSNFAPMYYLSPTKIIFTSARRGGVLTDPEKQDSKFLCDLYYAECLDSIWQRPVNFGRPVNSALHEGAGYITPDEVMLFTRWSDVNRNEAFIYMAKMNDGKFYEAMKLPTVNVQGYKSMHPYVNFDGTRLFFSSNRPGGKGGFDIWMCAIDENGNIGTPKNLGEPVNTSGDEVSPFYHGVSNTLYFSSTGLPGLGGLDIFKASFNVDDSVYAFPKNLAAPINSSKDDAYFIMERTQGRGMFASDREDCPAGHCYDIYEFFNEPIHFDLSGYVFDNETNDPIPGALVTIKDVHGEDEPLYVVTDDKGYYFTELKPDMELFMKAQKNKYFAAPGSSGNKATKGLTETTHLEQDFFLGKIPAGEIEIEGIEYDFNKATLREKSKENLDKIYDLLKLNDNLSIAINAHTDARGNDAYNEKLSQARAQSCVDYLLSKGIAKSRLVAKGWGEKQPLFTEEEINKMTAKSPEWEAAHQKNRRTAFKVIGEADIKIINKAK